MDNILTYVRFRGDIPFSKQPFCENDAMVLSILAGLNYENVVFKKTSMEDVVKLYEENGIHDELDDSLEKKEELLKLCAGSVRYGKLFFDNYVKCIDEKEEKTFYALTVYAKKREPYVIFRGTDGSLLSWKENFNAMCIYPTPGQRDALAYLSGVCSKRFSKVTVIGHSKGANIGLYAAMGLSDRLRGRLKRVYAFDGPGFMEDISEKLSFLDIKDRISMFIPKAAVIGKLMEIPVEKIIVQSNGNGLMQHDLFTWSVGPFGVDRAQANDLSSDELSSRLNDWLNAIPIEDRQGVVDELFSVFSKNGINHISGLLHLDIKNIINIGKCVTKLSSENRNLLIMILKEVRKFH